MTVRGRSLHQVGADKPFPVGDQQIVAAEHFDRNDAPAMGD